MPKAFIKDIQYYRFCLYGFFKNLRFFEAFLILFFLEKGLSFLAIGSLYAIREITVNIFEIPSGVIADTFGRRRTMILAFIFYIISFIVFYFSSAYGGFILAMIIFSLGEAFRSGNHKAMIFQYLTIKGWEGQKVHYYGHTRSWSQMGSALSALSGAAIVFISGSYAYIFLFSVIPYVLDLILVASYPKYFDENLQKFSWKAIWKKFGEVFRSLASALRSILVLRVLGSLSVYSGYYKAVKDYLQPVIAAWAVSFPLLISFEPEQRSAVLVGTIFFIVYLFSSFASRKSGYVSDLFSAHTTPMNISLLAGLACGILSGLFFEMDIWALSVFFFVVVYMIENVRKPVGVAYLGSSVDKKVLTTVLSVDSQLKSLTAAILAPIIGIFADLYGVGWGILLVSAGLAVLSPLIYLKQEQNG
jgi:MFS family permease